MSTVSLPEAPKEKEFEEFLAAHFQDAGLYVERNIIDRQEEEVLEIDMITTDYQPNAAPRSKLYEVKSGKWGFGEVFKLGGWVSYLKLENACLIVSQERTPPEFYERISATVNVGILQICEHKQARQILAEKEGLVFSNNETTALWRFSYWIERNLLRQLTNKKKSVEDKESYKTLDRYMSLVNNRSFFTESFIERAKRLYEAYSNHRNISAVLSCELATGTYDTESETIPTPAYTETFYECKLTDICFSTYVEHRARLSILKSAIDYQIRKLNGEDMEGDEALLESLPQSFKNAVDTLSSHPYFHKYPVFWQWFLWFMGGFILNDYKDQDFAFLAEKTGIPAEEIPHALEAYDILFPRPDGWFMDLKNSNIRIMHLFPTPFRGLGAHFRRIAYASGDVNKLKLTGRHTAKDLSKWINLSVELLSKNI